MRSYSVDTGENAENAVLKDSRYVRCQQCRFICHTDRDTHMPNGSRAGTGVDLTSTDATVVDIDGNPLEDAEVVSGCPLCGSFLYR